jgi:hypothetical protein
LRGLFPDAAVVDRREKPSFGYRAVHVMPRIGDHVIEIQVRSRLQHLWAELSEKYSDTIDTSIKYGGGPAEVRGLLASTSSMASDVEMFEQAILSRAGKDPSVGDLPDQIVSLRRDLSDDFARMIAGVDKLGGGRR